jgi:hypothetical protein
MNGAETAAASVSKLGAWWERKVEVAGRKLSSRSWARRSIMTGMDARESQLLPLRLWIPVALMMIYAWCGYRHTRSEQLPALKSARTSQLADSIYFLGFLWTLWALIDPSPFATCRSPRGVPRLRIRPAHDGHGDVPPPPPAAFRFGVVLMGGAGGPARPVQHRNGRRGQGCRPVSREDGQGTE